MVAEDVHIYVDPGMSVHIHAGAGTDTPGSPETLAAIQELDGKVTAMTDAVSQINASLTNIQGDLDGLKSAAQGANAANDDLQQALNQALASQGEAVQTAVNAAVAEQKAAADAALQEVVARAQTIAEQTADLPAPDQGAPADQTPPAETPPADQTTPPADQTPADSNPPVDQTPPAAQTPADTTPPADQTPPADTTAPSDVAPDQTPADPNAVVAADNTATPATPQP